MANNRQGTSTWLYAPAFDSLFILFPPFAALIAVLLMPVRFRATAEMPVMGWVILVLLVDVAHVYSTLFNTYFDKPRFRRHRLLYLAIPVACYLFGVVLHLIDGMLFWRVIAYLAVFHFIRQQYGFMRLYSRNDTAGRFPKIIDAITIYAATLYPLIYWHSTPGRNFNWFIEGDFNLLPNELIKSIAGSLYVLILILYAAKELWQYFTTKSFNLPKNLVVAGTVVSWYCGIVLFNGDMAFTALNVVAHGIPYMALVWAVTRKPLQQSNTSEPAPVAIFNRYNILVFLGSLFVLAYLEEGLWDGMIWREHTGVFHWFTSLPVIEGHVALSLLVPLLSLPQSTHYVLDGFIWKKKYA